MKRLLATMFVLLMVLALLPAAVLAAGPADVYVSATGSDDNAGTEQAPVATLTKALELVEAGGTVRVVGTVPVSTLSWPRKDNITVTGDTLDFTSLDGINVHVFGDTTFKNIELKFDNDENKIFACGNKVTVDEGVTTSGKIYLLGGHRYTDVASVDLTVLSGTWNGIFGGGTNAKVKGDVNLTVGGNTNADVSLSNHTFDYYVFGGGWNNKVDGKVNLTFTGNAKARYVLGGGWGSNAITTGGVNLEVSGGKAMTVFGGGKETDQNGPISLVITGGEVEQVYGGSLEIGQNADVSVELLGGKITRRVYGGCYNDYDGTWKQNGYVAGKVTLSIGNGVTISLGNELDSSIYARSRHSTVSETETSELIFLDSLAYAAYGDKLGAQDALMKSIMGDVTPADNVVITPAAQIGETTYNSLQEAVNKAGSETVKLLSDSGNATVSADLTLDLNGFDAVGITVDQAATLYLVDSATNDFKGSYGTAQVSGNVASFAELGNKAYLAVNEDGVYSAHRYALLLTHITLKPGADALGYKSRLYGDEIVFKYVDTVGFNLWVDEGNVVTGSKKFDGDPVAVLRLINILKNDGGEMVINGNAFATFKLDGKTVTTGAHTTSMKSALELIDNSFDDWTMTQKKSAQNLVTKFADKVEGWSLENIFGWSKECTVTGQLVKVDKTQLPKTVTLKSNAEIQTLSVEKDGTFSTTISSGLYEVVLEGDGYRSAAPTVRVNAGDNDLGQIKLLQKLTEDCVWNDGATITENGASVTVQTAATNNAVTEYKIGENITGAGAWTAETYVKPGSITKGWYGFTVGGNDANNGMIMFVIQYKSAVTDWRMAMHAWDTYTLDCHYVGRRGDTDIAVVDKDFDLSKNNQTFKLGTFSTDALSSADGYKLTLKAENIGTENETLTLYINDAEMLQLTDINFIGAVSGGKGVKDQVFDLSDVHVSLAAIGNNISATFSDYYCVAMGDGVVSGKVEKLDGTAGLPETVTLTSELNEVTLDVAADGTFSGTLPEGTYIVSGTLSGYRVAAKTVEVAAGKTANVTVKCLQNTKADAKWWDGATVTTEGNSLIVTTAEDANSESAYEHMFTQTLTTDPGPAVSSWNVGAHIEAGSTGNVGFSMGTQGGKDGNIFFYVNKDTGIAGYFSWGTFKYSGTIRTGGGLIEGNTVGYYPVSDEVKAMLNSEEGYDLKLIATNIDGARTGFLTLYVNDTAVLELANNFVGVQAGGKGLDNQRPHLSRVHLSMVAQGTGISATFTDYYLKTDSETGVAAGKVTGTFKKLDGTALPSGDVLVKFGEEYRLVRVTDGVFTTQLPTGTYALEYTVAGYRTACDSITVTEGQTTEVTIKLLQNLSVDCEWHNGATLTENGAGVTIQTAAKTDSMIEYKIGENITGAGSWIAETYVTPESTTGGYVGFTLGGNDANNGMIMFAIDYTNADGAGRFALYTWDTYKLKFSYQGRKGESNPTAVGTLNDTKKTFKFGTLSSASAFSENGYKLTLKAENIGTDDETLIFYIDDVEILRIWDLEITGMVSGNKGVAGQVLDLSNVHISLLNVTKGNTAKSATFSDYYVTVEEAKE